MSIPKIIHYCWFGGNPIPERDRVCIESWRVFCPEYQIIEWNESTYALASAPLYVRQAYEAKRWAFVTDYVRLQVVYEHGGIYLDTDVELIRDPTALLDNEAFFGFEDSAHINTGLGFGAVKGASILKELMEEYENISFLLKNGKIDTTPCPVRNTLTFLHHGLKQDGTMQMLNDLILILPSEYLSPLNYETGITEITDKTYSIHHYHASWQTQEEKAKIAEYKKYTTIFGEKMGNLIYQAASAFRTGGILHMARKIKYHFNNQH